jgi:hypothetical protein
VLSGKLPNRTPDHTWGGPGSGAECGICGLRIDQDETELEIEFRREDEGRFSDQYQVHVRCFGVWERERRSYTSQAAVAAGPAIPSIIGSASSSAAGRADPTSVARTSHRSLPDSGCRGKISGGGHTNGRELD